jgi:lipoate-protein ligase A
VKRFELSCVFDVSPEAALLLALDEALLMAAEAGQIGPTLHTWEFPRPTVVLGRSSKVDVETDRPVCARHGVDIYRRCSGGATILGGPGCLMYSVVLSIEQVPEIAKIDAAHDYVMRRVLGAVRRQLPEASRAGICDLTWQNRKFSGNALRMARRHVLYHGTVLYAADLALLAECLAFAPRQPEYRAGRDHRSFLTNAPIRPERLARDLADHFGAVDGDLSDVLSDDRGDDLSDNLPGCVGEVAAALALNRYGCEEWRFRH